jgi:ABC-2 type transport system ATP-binding protein
VIVPAISVQHAVVSYGERRALDGVALDVAAGTVVGLLGANGSGKSTLLSIISGLRRPDEGDVSILGAPIGAESRRRVGVVFQSSSLDPLMTLDETLLLHGRLFGLAGRTLSERTSLLLERFGLGDRRREAAGTLSGGLRRRLELARALLPAPQILLLDEPTTGLDPDAKRSFWQILRSQDGPPLTVLVATNDVLEAERECSSVAFLHQGRIVAQGTPAELKRGLKQDSVRVECTDGHAASLSKAIETWPGVGQVTPSGHILHVTVEDVASFVPMLFQTSPRAIHAVRVEPTTLEDAYFAVAGASLARDEERPA